MAITEAVIAAPPERVFGFLADGRSYERWVVGAKRIRGVDPGWPAPGSKIHHSVGIGPLVIKDTTKVAEVHEPSRLVLEARVRPTGVARVDIELRPEGGGTRIVMREAPVSGPISHLPSAVTDWLIDRRNRRALDRLKAMAEERPGS